MKQTITLFALVLALFVSCKKSSNSPNNNSTSVNYYLNANINGTAYSASLGTQGAPMSWGFSNQTGCTSAPYYMMNIGQIETSQFFLDPFLVHLENNAQFSTATTGNSFVIRDFDITANSSRGCNFDMMISLDDKRQTNQTTTLIASNKVNRVTNITQVATTSTDVEYAVTGNFTCSFINSVGQIIPVTGSYVVPVVALK